MKTFILGSLLIACYPKISEDTSSSEDTNTDTDTDEVLDLC